MTLKPKSLNVQRAISRADQHCRKGEFDLARDLLEPVLTRFPGNARARAAWAQIATKEAREQRPELTQAMVDQVFADREAGKLNEAMAEAKLLATAFPEEPVLHNFLATCHFDKGEHEKALNACKLAIKARADYPEAHLNISIAYRHLGQLDAAINHCKQALGFRPGYVGALVNLGRLLEMKERPDEAIATLQEALRLNPRSHEAYNNLAAVYRVKGDRAGAAEAFERSIEINPNIAEVHCNLSEMKEYVPGDAHISQMEALLTRLGIPASDKFPLGFALAKAYEDTADFDRSFAMLLDANKWRKETFGFDIADERKKFAAIRSTYDATVARHSNVSPEPAGRRPVFIVGLPRSGSTLVEQILASHSQVFGAGEISSVGSLLSGHLTDESAIKGLRSDDLRTIRTQYYKNIEGLGGDEPVVTDKLLANFMWAGFIPLVFPNAKIIHMRRDPMAVCWSMFKRRFANIGNGFAYDLDDLAQYHALYSDLMAFWKERANDAILDVDYEALTEDPEPQIRRILDYAGLPWEAGCLSFHTTKRLVRTASSEQVRTPIYTGSSEAWKVFEAHLAPLKSRLGQG